MINNLKSQIEKDFGLQIEYILNELLYGKMQNKLADLLDNRVLEPFTKDEIDKLKEKGQKDMQKKFHQVGKMLQKVKIVMVIT